MTDAALSGVVPDRHARVFAGIHAFVRASSTIQGVDTRLPAGMTTVEPQRSVSKPAPTVLRPS